MSESEKSRSRHFPVCRVSREARRARNWRRGSQQADPARDTSLTFAFLRKETPIKLNLMECPLNDLIHGQKVAAGHGAHGIRSMRAVYIFRALYFLQFQEMLSLGDERDTIYSEN
jgi:hypothetical protein